MRNGTLSHRRASEFKHQSVAKPQIQDIRARKAVPGGRPLHDYVNLYIYARNPMMYVLCSGHRDLCVLEVSAGVIDLAGAVITDGADCGVNRADNDSPRHVLSGGRYG